MNAIDTDYLMAVGISVGPKIYIFVRFHGEKKTQQSSKYMAHSFSEKEMRRMLQSSDKCANMFVPRDCFYGWKHDPSNAWVQKTAIRA